MACGEYQREKVLVSNLKEEGLGGQKLNMH